LHNTTAASLGMRRLLVPAKQATCVANQARAATSTLPRIKGGDRQAIRTDS